MKKMKSFPGSATNKPATRLAIQGRGLMLKSISKQNKLLGRAAKIILPRGNR